MPTNGVFVGFELLIIDKNKSTGSDMKGNNFTLYSPYLNFIRVEDEDYFWLYTKGKWIKTKQEVPDFLIKEKIVYLKPAISLKLTN
jgi:hypothetical protein